MARHAGAATRASTAASLLGGGQAHLVADVRVASDGGEGLGRGARIDGRDLLGGGQAHLVADVRIASDGGEGLGGSRGVVFG